MAFCSAALRPSEITCINTQAVAKAFAIGKQNRFPSLSRLQIAKSINEPHDLFLSLTAEYFNDFTIFDVGIGCSLLPSHL